jgi:hypothetical protein
MHICQTLCRRPLTRHLSSADAAAAVRLHKVASYLRLLIRVRLQQHRQDVKPAWRAGWCPAKFLHYEAGELHLCRVTQHSAIRALVVASKPAAAQHCVHKALLKFSRLSYSRCQQTPVVFTIG